MGFQCPRVPSSSSAGTPLLPRHPPVLGYSTPVLSQIPDDVPGTGLWCSPSGTQLCTPPTPPPHAVQRAQIGSQSAPSLGYEFVTGQPGRIRGGAGWAWTGGGGSPLRGWGGVGRDAPACLGAGRGPGQAVSALVREQGRLFLFHFPPMESPERELAVCLGGLVGLGDALSPFPCLAFSRAMGCGHSSPLASLTPFLLLCLRSSHRL